MKAPPKPKIVWRRDVASSSTVKLAPPSLCVSPSVCLSVSGGGASSAPGDADHTIGPTSASWAPRVPSLLCTMLLYDAALVALGWGAQSTAKSAARIVIIGIISVGEKEHTPRTVDPLR